MMAVRVHEGRLTPAVKESVGRMLGATIGLTIRDLVTDLPSNTLNASAPVVVEDVSSALPSRLRKSSSRRRRNLRLPSQAIASKLVDPKRIIPSDVKSYGAILLDDNNRKTIARIHFDGITTKYLGTFTGKHEPRNLISELTPIYQFSPQIEACLRELDDKIPA